MKITLELQAEHVQYILNQLAERPFKEVGDLIPLIMQQSNAQLLPPVPAAPAAPELPQAG